MASKQSPSTSTFIEEGQGPMSQVPMTAHGNLDVTTTSAHSYSVPKYVTDVARLISASAESRRMFLTEVTRTCLEFAAKKEKADSHQMNSLQLGQPITNANTTSTEYNISVLLHPVILQLNQLQQCSIHQALR